MCRMQGAGCMVDATSFEQDIKHLLRSMDSHEIAIEPAATLKDAQEAFVKHQPRILVFSGHTVHQIKSRPIPCQTNPTHHHHTPIPNRTPNPSPHPHPTPAPALTTLPHPTPTPTPAPTHISPTPPPSPSKRKGNMGCGTSNTAPATRPTQHGAQNTASVGIPTHTHIPR